jgi:hypothetical protein
MVRKTDKRLDDLENASGVNDQAVCIQMPDEPLAKLCMPAARSGEEISVADFRTQHPDGLIINIVSPPAPYPEWYYLNTGE